MNSRPLPSVDEIAQFLSSDQRSLPNLNHELQAVAAVNRAGGMQQLRERAVFRVRCLGCKNREIAAVAFEFGHPLVMESIKDDYIDRTNRFGWKWDVHWLDEPLHGDINARCRAKWHRIDHVDIAAHVRPGQSPAYEHLVSHTGAVRAEQVD